MVAGAFSKYVEKNHARRRGLARRWLAESGRAFGAFRDYEFVDWSRVNRLVFVCTGNICRSAYADVRAGLLKIPTASFGLHARSGDPADEQASLTARQHDVEMSANGARCQDEVPLHQGNLLLAMEPWQADELVGSAHRVGAQVSLLALWSSRPRAHLEDPYGRGLLYFETCMTLVDEAVEECRLRMEGNAP